MAQIKNIQASNRFWNLVITAGIGVTLSACGGRSSNRMTTTRDGFSNFTNSQTVLTGTGGGQLPSNPVSSVTGAPNSGTNSQNNPTSPSFPEGLLMINQTANDFGLLNYCYNSILNRGKELLGSGTPADYVFKGAGQELYRCYNEVLQRRAQELQAYQTYQREQQLRDYWNAYYQAILQSQLRGNYSDIQVTPPPSGGINSVNGGIRR